MPFVIQSTCIACHNCALECPVGAIGFVHTKYEIDPDKCIGCGQCAQLCNISAILDTDHPKTVTPHDPVELETDVVVLGGGASGLIAAVRAAEKGCRVTVLEKAEKLGGNAWYASGFMTFGSQYEQDEGAPDLREQMISYYNDKFQGAVSPELVRKTVYASGAFFNWLEAIDPAETRESFAIGPAANFFFLDPDMKTTAWKGRKFYNLKNRDAAIGPGSGGSYVIRQMLRRCAELGVVLRTGHEAVRLIADETGGFAAVECRDAGGTVTVRGKACVLCTGGWTRNDRLIREHYPEFFGEEGSEPTHRFAVPTVTGDVIPLGKSIGAAVDEKNLWMNIFGPVHHPFSFTFLRFGMQPENIFVNLEGKRFFNEDSIFAAAGPMLHQPGRVVYAMVDADTLQLFADRLIGQSDRIADSWVFQEYQQDLAEEIALGTPVKKADTIAELAAQCGIDPAALEETMARYNEACQTGKDTQFGKTPANLRPLAKAPYYAFFNKMATDGAFGGVKTDASLRVLRPDGSVISGLYACGDNSGSWGLRGEGEGDHRAFLLSELSWAVTSGFMGGAIAAEELRA